MSKFSTLTRNIRDRASSFSQGGASERPKLERQDSILESALNIHQKEIAKIYEKMLSINPILAVQTRGARTIDDVEMVINKLERVILNEGTAKEEKVVIVVTKLGQESCKEYISLKKIEEFKVLALEQAELKEQLDATRAFISSGGKSQTLELLEKYTFIGGFRSEGESYSAELDISAQKSFLVAYVEHDTTGKTSDMNVLRAFDHFNEYLVDAFAPLKDAGVFKNMIIRTSGGTSGAIGVEVTSFDEKALEEYHAKMSQTEQTAPKPPASAVDFSKQEAIKAEAIEKTTPSYSAARRRTRRHVSITDKGSSAQTMQEMLSTILEIPTDKITSKEGRYELPMGAIIEESLQMLSELNALRIVAKDSSSCTVLVENPLLLTQICRHSRPTDQQSNQL